MYTARAGEEHNGFSEKWDGNNIKDQKDPIHQFAIWFLILTNQGESRCPKMGAND